MKGGKGKAGLIRALKAYRRSGGVAALILNLGTRCGGKPLPLRKDPVTHWRGVWVTGSSQGDTNFAFVRTQIPDPPAHNLFASIIMLSWLLLYVWFWCTFRTSVTFFLVNIRKVLRPVTSTQVFLGFAVSKTKCWDGSQDSKLPLHASHVALPT